ncbi:hypothetical protein BC351_40195 [Paenibacillus ferrarius]|uniref:TreTu toxin C-terminal domain-containing protein n=1 Tax=Paenibacillus ferrarius TaxID=1469647 RepID=A0A1V4H849_9BACL|nr:hypothetical protein [Paenibacillus ferrarius]OPH47378.1 hypothetical protein BC351_40195 [Paenibacillus ferrarius]
MLEDPSWYNIGNWATMGTFVSFNGALNPAEPLSLEHWADSAATALTVVGGLKVSGSGKIVAKGVGDTVAQTVESTRVGRWMSKDEYNKMIETGRVQEGGGGQTYAAFSKDAFQKQAASDAIYVEFNVPASTYVVTNSELGWIKFVSPTSLEGRLAARKGIEIPSLPEAKDITLIGGKNE